jgi:glycosyltransferase involved in cell wall biosynthesis
VAAFTYDLATTVGEREIVALHPAGGAVPYPAEVRHRIRRDDQADYVYMAQALNDCGVDVVSLQYLPAIWGNEGAFVLDFVRSLDVPVVTTIHEVPAAPSAAQRQIVAELADTSGSLVAMSAAASERLRSAYGIAARQIEIVPHGVWNLPLMATETVKPRLGLRDQTVILSFGLIAPGKGFETVIDAMPAIVKAVPDARYIIVGPTSPDGPEGEAEAYRADLERRAAALKLGEHVKFVDRFLGRVELATWLEAADVVVAPSLDLERTVSGTLACALGAGRAIVSTPSAYATELLADGRGRLVAPSDPKALAAEITGLLARDEERIAMGRRAYEHARPMVWWEVGNRYRRLFDRATRSHAHEPETSIRNVAARVG